MDKFLTLTDREGIVIINANQIKKIRLTSGITYVYLIDRANASIGDLDHHIVKETPMQIVEQMRLLNLCL